MGACIALQFAISYPQKVLSLFLISPLPLEEVCIPFHRNRWSDTETSCREAR